MSINTQQIQEKDKDYVTKRANDKKISNNIKNRKHEFPDVNSITNRDGYNPITKEKEDISEWLSSSEDNLIITMDDTNYCVSKLWIRNALKQYTFIECDEYGKPIQHNVKGDKKYINLNIVGIVSGLIPFDESEKMLKSTTNKYVIRDTGEKNQLLYPLFMNIQHSKK